MNRAVAWVMASGLVWVASSWAVSAAPQLRSAAIVSIDGMDQDSNGYYETFRFEFEFDAACEEGMQYDMATRIYCSTTSQGWYTESWSVAGINSGEVFVVFDQSDFTLSGKHVLDFTAELWDSAFSTKYAGAAGIPGEPLRVEVPGSEPPTGDALLPPILSSPRSTSMVLTLNGSAWPAETFFCVRCVSSRPVDPKREGTYVWPLEGQGLRFDVPVWRTLDYWQNLTLTNPDLLPRTTYTFVARARYDGVESQDSQPASLATLAEGELPPGELAIVTSSANSMLFELDCGANPADTLFAIQCVVTFPADNSYGQMWVGRCGRPSAEPLWRTAEEWTGAYAASLKPLTTYVFAAATQGPGPGDTILGPPTSAETTGPGDVNGDGKANILDLIGIRGALLQTTCSSPAAAAADMNGDGTVNLLDMITWLSYYNMLYPEQ